jgi:hypothetical protein
MMKSAEIRNVLDEFAAALEMPEIREAFDREWSWFQTIRRKAARAKRELL